jgi:nicotinamidase-related amidase
MVIGSLILGTSLTLIGKNLNTDLSRTTSAAPSTAIVFFRNSGDPKEAMTTLIPQTTALVMIDLQNGILRMPGGPRSGAQVVASALDLATRVRTAGGCVVWVRVAYSLNFADALVQPVDLPTPRPQNGLPAGWSDLAEGLAAEGDIHIVKRQWGAFHGTELDLQLRRRHVETVVLGGVATNFGVESTARQAWEHGYSVVLVEDACAGVNAELHEVAIKHIFPRISRVIQSDELVFVGNP